MEKKGTKLFVNPHMRAIFNQHQFIEKQYREKKSYKIFIFLYMTRKGNLSLPSWLKAELPLFYVFDRLKSSITYPRDFK